MLVSTYSLSMLPVLATGIMGVQSLSSSSLMGKSAILTYEDVFGVPFRSDYSIDFDVDDYDSDKEYEEWENEQKENNRLEREAWKDFYEGEHDFEPNFSFPSSLSNSVLNLSSVAGSVLKTVAKYKYLKLALIVGSIMTIFKLAKKEKGGAF